MDNPENSLVIASTRQLPTFELNNNAKEAKAQALEKAALIGKVTGHDSKVIAVRAQQQLKGVIAGIEKARKQLKEPLLIAGRQLDTLCATESLELEKEFGRISNAVQEFDNEERRRVREEQELQERELARIQKEKDDALAKATTPEEVAAIEEKAGDAAYVAARPVEITKVSGQRTVGDYEITSINEWVLMKARPDLVRKIEFDMRALKDALKKGDKLPGVVAKEVYKADVRLAPNQKAIEV